MRTLKIGVAGLGQAAGGVMPTMMALPEIELIAGADILPEMRSGFERRYPGVRAFDSIAAMCTQSEVDAVWVSTPNKLHCEHAIEVMRHGKHVIVEKPMAISLEEADRMIAAAQQYGVILIAGHTSSYQLSVRAMRRIIQSGKLGPVEAIFIWSYTDWMLRPRTPDELVFAEGGGIPHRQGPHQIDVVRLLGGGKVKSVRGAIGMWRKERPIPGFYTAFMEFENGIVANLTHNGYGYFNTAELYPWAPAMHRYKEPDRIAFRRALHEGGRNEVAEKAEWRIGGKNDKTMKPAPTEPLPWTPYDMGMLIVSCERGDIRHSKYGLTVYGDDGPVEVDLRGVGRSEVDFEGGATIPPLLEMHAAVTEGKPVYHGGEWGRATLEAMLAIIASGQQHREIVLQKQVAMPDEYDADFRLELPGPAQVR
jgi:phthalate 4,5-cis-dihydrodiol dehydrogenase